MAQASRLLAKGYDEITGRDIETLCADDFPSRKRKRCERPKIGIYRITIRKDLSHNDTKGTRKCLILKEKSILPYAMPR